ncbi:GNAT family N-acetyltransferase [Peteryoungia desertarenae]|uniref:GNAT family N-acetyltransferase n=1 Tax=Peteryoungia desertarenae TaxID=1813451 RepID=A0ABX6QN76_9HYPH|nr:GNAT family N-acetyltransferase [Peteryoungia desertarenae]QLF70073.1 GNAT family N-acetyltransferase [Peteryoungia desertarenae]
MTMKLHSDMASVETIWRLLEADPLNSLHQGYDWCRAWEFTHHRPVAILEGCMGQETAFLLPLEIRQDGPVRKAQFMGSEFSNINTGLIASRHRRELAALDRKELAAALRNAVKDVADLIWLSNVPLRWRGVQHPFAGLDSVENQNHAFQLELRPTMEETIAPLNAKRRRKKYRTQLRKIEAVGTFEHVKPKEAIEKQVLLDLFFEQKRKRFEALGLPDVFQAAETQAFFHLLLEADRGGSNIPLELHALRLNLGGEHQIAAISGLSRKGDHVICQFGSIEPDCLPEASPGELLFWLMIEQESADGQSLFDFGIGDQDYKRSWCNIETVHHDIVLPINAKGQLAALALKLTTKTKALIKGNPKLYAFIQRLRAGKAKRNSTVEAPED